MIECRMKDRRGVTLIELLVVVLIVSILAAIAQPQLTGVIVKARAADAISDMQLVRQSTDGVNHGKKSSKFNQD